MSFIGNIFGDTSLQNIDQQIDNIIASSPIRDMSDDSSEEDASNLINQILAIDDKFSDPEKIKKNPFYKDFSDRTGIMNDVGTLLDKLTLQPERAARYKTYDEIYQSIPMIKKMLQVWLSNLIQKNPVSGKSLMVKDKDEDNPDLSSNDDVYKNKKMVARIFVDELLEYFDFVNKLKYKILPTQELYGDCFVEIINLKDFNLAPEKNKEVDVTTNSFDVDGFIGESSLYTAHDEESPIRSSNRKSNKDQQKLKKIQKKIASGSFNLDEVCNEISEIFVDTEWDQNEDIISESFAESLKKGKKEILIRERAETKVIDTPECFFEYIQNNAGEFKPFLKFRPSEKSGASNNDSQPKRRGRPPKKTLTEDDESIVKIAKNLGIKTQLDMSNILMLIHRPQSIVILETNYGTKLGYVEVADKEATESYNIYNC